MPRKPRMFLPDLPAHIVQRGNNRQPIFFEDEDYVAYLSFIAAAALRYGCMIHAYVLMTNHVHLLLTPSSGTAISQALQYTGRHYVPYVNRKYQRTGTLWEGRFKASIVDSSEYLFACYRYIEMNPVRAGMVLHPANYRWSSHACNGLGAEDPVVSPHSQYLTLGAKRSDRARNYRLLFEGLNDDVVLDEIRLHTQSGTPLGDQRFQKQIEQALSVTAGYVLRGRPEARIECPLISPTKPIQKGL